MGAIENSNALSAWALVQVQSLTDYRIVRGSGVRELVRVGVGLYNLRLVEPMDYSVNQATLAILRAQQVMTFCNLAGVLRRLYCGVVPLTIPPGAYEAGSVAMGFANAADVNIDDGLGLVQIWTFPSID